MMETRDLDPTTVAHCQANALPCVENGNNKELIGAARKG